MLFPLFKAPGRSFSDGLLFGLMGLLVVLALFAVGRAVVVQQQVSHAFEDWHDDYLGYQKALAEQKKSGKPVLVYFYATWCPHCKRFTEKVLSTSKVREALKRYPRVRIAPDNGPAEKALMENYGADGFPSLYMVKANGEKTKLTLHTVQKNEARLQSADEFIVNLQRTAGE